MTNLENLKALLALKAQADPLAAQLATLGAQWKTAADAVTKAMDQSKTYTFTADDGSVKLVFFQNGQLMLGDAVAAETVPEPAPEPEPEPSNVVSLAQA